MRTYRRAVTRFADYLWFSGTEAAENDITLYNTINKSDFQVIDEKMRIIFVRCRIK